MPDKSTHSAAASELWLLAAIVALGAVLRLTTLDLQSYSHEEAVTASRVLHAGLGDTLSAIPDSESTPPLYYLLAWLWSVPFGVGEIALRSLSALIGIGAIPVAYLAARELSTPRVGLVTAAIVAASPMLIWYSQDARAYSLLVLLSALSFLFTVRGLRGGSGRDLGMWALFSALALATHYFAIFVIAIEAALLLLRLRSRGSVLAVAAVVAAGLALLPLALHQSNIPNNDWISGEPLLDRIADVPRKFLLGETGAYINVYGRDGQSAYLNRALIPGLVVVAGLVMLYRFGDDTERRGARLALGVGGGAVVAAVLLAIAGPDYLLARNLLAAYVPLAIVVACGLGARRAGRLGIGLAAGLCVALTAFAVYADVRPALRNDDWRAVAKQLGPARSDRLIVSPYLGDDPLTYYVGDGLRRDNAFAGRVRDVIAVGYGPPRHQSAVPSAFAPQGRRRIGYFTVAVYRAPRPEPVRGEKLAGLERVGDTRGAVLVIQPGAP
jgi:mannosyltransferase